MAKAVFYQAGESLDYTNSGDSTIEANSVVAFGQRVGVAGCDILPGETGSLHMTGVFYLPVAEAVSAGALLYWDATGGKVTATSTGNIPAGFAAAACSADDTLVLVKING